MVIDGANEKECGKFPNKTGKGIEYTICCNKPVTGTGIRIQISGMENNILQFVEVKVYKAIESIHDHDWSPGNLVPPIRVHEHKTCSKAITFAT